MGYIDKLIENCQIAKNATLSETFEMKNLSDLDSIDKAIYVIEEIDGNSERTFINFAEYKKTKQRMCARLNTPSNVMYVGSSTTGLKKRISQHLGHEHKGTYALHLSHWFNGKYKITIKMYDVENEVLQIIEDDLSDILKPAFGKQGGNNK
jgi:Uri superfamily endonuclease